MTIAVDRNYRTVGCPNDPCFATIKRPISDLRLDMEGNRFEVDLFRIGHPKFLKQ
jgi:hypothetical protein